MKILFLTMAKTGIDERGIYSDLMRKFRNEGHDIFVVMPTERREGLKTSVSVKEHVHMLSVRTLNLQKTNVIEKGIGQISMGFLFNHAINKYLKGIKFDLILYSTPPIYLTKVIASTKKHNPATKSYLMLKDIFPQNALDMGMLSKTGLKGLLYRSFRNKEKQLYALSDTIGCMSPANVNYIIDHNPEVDPSKVEVCPNSLELFENEDNKSLAILNKYNLPKDKPLFIYGGNLGKPQGIPFLLKCLEANKNRNDCHFVVVGTGTYYSLLAEWYKRNVDSCVTIIPGLPKTEYDQLARLCNVGMVFLDYNFTIPNFPSRLLSYLEYKMPVICATDPVCDMGLIAEQNGFGYWVPSNSVSAFTQCIERILHSDISAMGERGYQYLARYYTTDNTYNAIMAHINE